jgi:protein-disulfide isomerase
MILKRFIVGLFLALLPFIAVEWVKQTDWGPLLSVPPARQLGPSSASVTIFEYSDFQCPSCSHAQEPLHRLMDAYKGIVRLAYKYFPLKMHKNAMPAAHAAECAAAQNKFWPFHDQLFQTQNAWGPLTDPTTSFMAIAQSSQLDIPVFTTCYADPSRMGAIQDDMAEGNRREVKATPTFFIGDTRLVGGGPLEGDGARTIERELRK